MIDIQWLYYSSYIGNYHKPLFIGILFPLLTWIWKFTGWPCWSKALSKAGDCRDGRICISVVFESENSSPMGVDQICKSWKIYNIRRNITEQKQIFQNKWWISMAKFYSTPILCTIFNIPLLIPWQVSSLEIVEDRCRGAGHCPGVFRDVPFFGLEPVSLFWLPSKVYITLENHDFSWENSLILWSLSTALLSHQRDM